MTRQFFTRVVFQKTEIVHSITHTNDSSNFENFLEILVGLVSVFEQGCFLHVPHLYAVFFVSHFVVTALLTL